VPGTSFTACSISRATFSITASSLPKTFTPTGVRMPVDSMSMRALIGIVHELATPGNFSAASISLPAHCFLAGCYCDGNAVFSE
jgi:hypothetical protein